MGAAARWIGGSGGDTSGAVREFGALYAQLRGTAAAPAELDPTRLASVLDGQPDLGQKADALAAHVALHTPLTVAAARPIAQAAVAGSGGSSQAAAQQVAAQLSGLTGSVDLELSKPDPLPAALRLVFAVAMVGIVLAALILVAAAHSSGTAEYVALGILGGLSWLGAVILVMGYANVTVKGSSGSAGSAGSPGGAG